MKIINNKWLFVAVIIVLLVTILVVVRTKEKRVVLECKRAGCSNQLCVSTSEPATITTCEWQEKYKCYQQAKCEVQIDGRCGFTKDEKLEKCLSGLMPKIIKLIN